MWDIYLQIFVAWLATSKMNRLDSYPICKKNKPRILLGCLYPGVSQYTIIIIIFNISGESLRVYPFKSWEFWSRMSSLPVLIVVEVFVKDTNNSIPCAFTVNTSTTWMSLRLCPWILKQNHKTYKFSGHVGIFNIENI